MCRITCRCLIKWYGDGKKPFLTDGDSVTSLLPWGRKPPSRLFVQGNSEHARAVGKIGVGDSLALIWARRPGSLNNGDPGLFMLSKVSSLSHTGTLV